MTEYDEEPIWTTLTISYSSKGEWRTVTTEEEFNDWVAGKLP